LLQIRGRDRLPSAEVVHERVRPTGSPGARLYWPDGTDGSRLSAPGPSVVAANNGEEGRAGGLYRFRMRICSAASTGVTSAWLQVDRIAPRPLGKARPLR